MPTVLDLKDVFFCLPLVPISQPILRLNRLVLREDLQAIWLGLGCHKIKKLFHALWWDLQCWIPEFLAISIQRAPRCILCVQLFDDSEAEEEWKKASEGPLGALQALGHQVSVKKAQLCTPCVTYLGYNLEGGKQTPSRDESQWSYRPPHLDKRISIGISGE